MIDEEVCVDPVVVTMSCFPHHFEVAVSDESNRHFIAFMFAVDAFESRPPSVASAGMPTKRRKRWNE